jgi:hypothetical protein
MPVGHWKSKEFVGGAYGESFSAHQARADEQNDLVPKAFSFG